MHDPNDQRDDYNKCNTQEAKLPSVCSHDLSLPFRSKRTMLMCG
jgi:hypothetical protein